MALVMIDMKKIKEKKDLSYLDSWYCPLEKADKLGINNINNGNIAFYSSAPYTSRLTFDRVSLSIPNRHVMAGL